jgi:4-methyl-5(b-hydroxyethyl)-thiazole monophosphate biosynthesis
MMADGTEECEALLTVNLLRRAEIPVYTVSVNDEAAVRTSHNIQMKTDLTFAEADCSAGTMLVLPGGMPGTLNLGAHAGLSELIDEYAAAGKWLAAICAAPSILGKKGLLDGKAATCYPSFSDQLGDAVYTGKPVEVAGRIVTGKGLGASLPFSLKLIELLTDRERAQQVADRIYYEFDF